MPHSYMNIIGKHVLKCFEALKLSQLNEMMIICDELDLENGKWKIKQGGSSKGHNRIKSI